MSGVRYEIRPLGEWDRPVTAERRSAGTFRASWADTLRLLKDEVGLLGGHLVVLQLDADETDIRLDGMLRSRALVRHPGVKVSFESDHGPLTYATDAYDRIHGYGMPGWQANVRAIALALGALRAVDRYGVTRRGEQYLGWTAIAAKPEPMTAERAAAFIAAHADGFHADTILANPAYGVAAFRAAARVLHPDRGGNAEQFAQLTEARQILEGRP